MSFKSLKQSNNIDQLTKELDKQNQGGFQKDERLWNVERDKTGNGFAIIRFLPASEGEDVPWVRMYNHSFKNAAGQWFIENCPTTKGSGTKCPVCEANSVLWNSGIKANQEIVSAKYKRKLRYTSNILVISDPAHRENEGKVFLFNYGKKIHDKIVSCMKPAYAGEQGVNPFDLWKGRSFKIKAKTVGSGEAAYANYDDSEWMPEGPLFPDDAQMEAVWNKQYKLAPLVANDQFKDYEVLKKKYNEVMGASSSTAAQATTLENMAASSKPPFTPNKSTATGAATTAAPQSEGEDDDNLSYFKKLSEE